MKIERNNVGTDIQYSSEDILTTVINNVDDMICARDREGALLVWNNAFADSLKIAFGIEPYVGMKTVDLIAHDQRQNFDKHRAFFKKALAGENIRCEFEYILPDGKTNHYEIAWSPIRKDNEITWVAEITRNITNIKRLNIELDKSNERFRAFIQNSTEDIYCFEFELPLDVTLPEDEQIDHFYKYAYVAEANDSWARAAGYEHGKDMLGIRFEDFLPRSKPESIATLKKYIFAQYFMDNHETYEVYPNGVERYVSNTVIGIKENGQLVRIWGTGRDITKELKMEKELIRKEKDLQRLAGRLIMDQEKELHRLSRELHDDLTQRLAVLAIDAAKLEKQFQGSSEPTIQKLLDMKRQLIDLSKDMHSMARQLHPSILDDLGIVRAFESECSAFMNREEMAIQFTAENIPDHIPNDVALCLYRIMQESLRNIAQHAHAKEARISLTVDDNGILLSIQDSGKGFDPAKVRHEAGLGLGSMRERVRLVRGTLSIQSHPGKGTLVAVWAPLQRSRGNKQEQSKNHRLKSVME